MSGADRFVGQLIGAILVVLVSLIVVVTSIFSSVFVWRLYRKSALMETKLDDLMGSLSRQQQVVRLERDRDRKKPRPRRRRAKAAHA